MKRFVYKGVLIVAVAVFLFSGWRLFSIYREYKAGSDEYAEVAQHVMLVEAPKEEKQDLTEQISSVEITQEETFLSVDFDALREINPDIVAWVYMENLGISYPVVQGQDNEKYLHRTFEGQYNGSGCIFEDYLAAPDFTDFNTFLYGHNMKNGTMFGSLKRLRRESDLYDENPYFYIYTEDFIYKYRICSFYVTPPDSDSYLPVHTKEEYEQYTSKIIDRSLRDCSVDELETSANMVTLSTCSGSGETKQRFLVHGLEEDRLENTYH